MERLTMCRICLATNVRMHVLINTHLQEIYEELTAIPLTTKDSRPVVACYVCCARLRNCYQLRKRCLQSDKLLATIMTSNGLESSNQDTSITNTLRITPVLHLSMGDVVQNKCLQPVNVQLKREPPEVEVIVKREDSEDAENEFLPEYYIMTLEDNKQPIDPEDLILDTAHAKSKLTMPRLKFEDSPPRQQESRRYSEKNNTTSFTSHAQNETINDKECFKLSKSFCKSYKCDVCEKLFSRKTSFLSHNCKHTDKRYECEICCKLFSSNSILCQHVRAVHDADKPYKCNNRDKTYRSKNQLKDHSRVHSTKVLYKCKICNKKYTAKHNLQRHAILAHIRNSDKKLFTCDICKKDFASKGSIFTHMRIHTGEKPYQCDVCKKSFSDRSTLTKHVLVHGDERPFICDKCDKRFKRKSHLDSHIHTHTLSHSGDRQYTCEVCNKSFFQKAHLNDHFRIHTGEKPFPCEICEENFRYKSSIKRHMIRAHNMNLVG